MTELRHADELWDLERLAGAQRLGDWMFAQVEPSLGPRAAEIGAGIGTFTERLLDGGVKHLLALEPDPICAERLEQRFGRDTRVELSRDMLPGSPTLGSVEGTRDLVLCQNVLEHIDDDYAATEAMAAALAPGGTLLLLVPAHPRLYGRLDGRFGHERRYDRPRLRSLIGAAGLALDELYSFNSLGIIGWWAKNRLANPSLDQGSLRAYEIAVRVWRPIEERIRPRWGLSLIARAHRP